MSGRLSTSLVLASLAFANPAVAQDRGQIMLDLSRVLGEAHALRQLCEGADDYFWRDRMSRLLLAEGLDEPSEIRLRETFNEGYERRLAQFDACSPATREAEGRVRLLGARLSRRMKLSPPPAEKLAPG